MIECIRQENAAYLAGSYDFQTESAYHFSIAEFIFRKESCSGRHDGETMKSLTLRYSAIQFSYWAATTGASAFAAAYLLERNIPSAAVGAVLAAAGVLSCIAQPFLAAAQDREQAPVLSQVLIKMSALCCLCFALQLLPGLPLFAVGFCYMAGVFCASTMQPLLNALCVASNQAGYPVNYGAARGAGAAASALATLFLGASIERLGVQSLPVFVLALRALSMLMLAGYPVIRRTMVLSAPHKRCSVTAFILRYRWYCASLCGIALLGMFHARTDNYLIAILQRLGGGSSHVGTALFISSLSAAPVIFFFSTIRKHARDTTLLKIAAVSFLLKSAGFCLVRRVEAVYLLQLLQMTSYALLAPAEVEYAGARVRQEDMVKGQALITAAYALGCSAGNFAGGQLLSFGVSALLEAGVGMALAGTVVIFLTADRQDASITEQNRDVFRTSREEGNRHEQCENHLP